MLLKCKHCICCYCCYYCLLLLLFVVVIIYFHSLACDVFDNKLEVAKKLGADIIINTKRENLKSVGKYIVCCSCTSLYYCNYL